MSEPMEIIMGSQPRRVRLSRTYQVGRVCARAGCPTKLSVYNRREFCDVHAPLRFPRVRGRMASEGI